MMSDDGGGLAAIYAEAASLLRSNRLDEAKQKYEYLNTVNPGDPHVLASLGKILVHQNDLAAAERAFHEALRLKPGSLEAGLGLAMVMRRNRRLSEAAQVYRELTHTHPDIAGIHNDLGNLLADLGEFAEAAGALHAALRLRPDLAAAHTNLGRVCRMMGDLDQAEEHYRRAVSLAPADPHIHSNLVMFLNYSPRIDGRRLFDEHRQWAERHGTSVPHFRDHENDPDPGRRLRVGYVSRDFRRHPVAFFITPVMANHDPRQVEIHAYSQGAGLDPVGRLLRSFAAQWRSIAPLGDAATAELIRRDRIDILVDLAGHSGEHRLMVFARRPAPVQVSYLGYPATTGLDTVDYRLTDAQADPPGMTDHLHSEKLVCLPAGFLCYQPAAESPAVAPPPADGGGGITFGSMNNLSKVNADVISAWASILRSLPGSRLLLKNLSLGDAAVRRDYLARFERLGVDADRILLRPPIDSYSGHRATYNEIDLGLDTFPYNGTTTTCEALWMGVPVVTMAGRLHAGRVGSSILVRLGLDELVAHDGGQYERIARELAHDTGRLRRLRRELRGRMLRSPLCDGVAFARTLETAYRQMWTAWCVTQNTPPGATPG